MRNKHAAAGQIARLWDAGGATPLRGEGIVALERAAGVSESIIPSDMTASYQLVNWDA